MEAGCKTATPSHTAEKKGFIATGVELESERIPADCTSKVFQLRSA